MGRQRIVLRVVEEIDCPLFRAGDRMVLELPGVDVRASTAVCALAISKFLPIREAVDCGDFELLIRTYRFECPRPTNPVVFEVSEVDQPDAASGAAGALGGDVARSVAALRSIPVFRALPARALERVLQSLRIVTFASGDRILERGQEGRTFYVVYRGQVEVLGETAGGETGAITRLGVKECFGEISLLTGSPCTSTVRAMGETALLAIDKPDFERMLQENPALAGLFTRLLAKRLSATNLKLAEEEDKAFTGKLSVLGFPEVVQSLGEARRSGTLVLENGGREARIGFREGRVHEIGFGDLAGAEAFYEVLAWTDGEFWFDERTVPVEDRVGRDLMELLLEGLRRMDERGRGA